MNIASNTFSELPKVLLPGVLGRFEETLLGALLIMATPSSVMDIKTYLENQMVRKRVSISVLYATLERLEDKGYVAASEEGPTPKPGGRRKSLFYLTSDGHQALNDLREYNERIWQLSNTRCDVAGS
jgi:PadR family transcriptional regulator